MSESPLYPVQPDIEEETEEEEVTTPGKLPSFIDLLREDYKELTEQTDVFIPVKGYERVGLQVKYRMPTSGRELDDLSRKVMRESKDTFSRNINVAMDTMIVLCEGLYIQPLSEELGLETPQVEEPVPLDPDLTGEPTRFDQRLAEALGLEGEIASSRQVVRSLFGGNDIAVISHAERLSRWIADHKANLDVEFWQLGEGI